MSQPKYTPEEEANAETLRRMFAAMQPVEGRDFQVMPLPAPVAE